jgi:predicted GNAT family acetyltransferase
MIFILDLKNKNIIKSQQDNMKYLKYIIRGERTMNWIYEDNRIYCKDEKGELMAEATFVSKENGKIDIDHVYVNPSLRGQGMAGKTMTVVAEYVRKMGWKATASCSYANGWFMKNQDAYGDIMADEIRDQAVSCKIDGNH